MRRLTWEAFERRASMFDALVGRAAYLDRFCSSTAWIVPAHEALMPPRDPWLFADDTGTIAMAIGRHREGFRYAEPLEASWGLACPIVAADPAAASGWFVDHCARRVGDWDVIVVCGVLDDAPLHAALVRALAARWRVQLSTTTERHVASLAGGLDGFLARRSRSLRRSLRRAARAARDAGIEIVAATGDPHAVYERILAVERRTWKGRAGTGIVDGAMQAFYRAMVARLAAIGALRVMIARGDGRDVAYILGGVIDGRYRGLQFGYDVACRRWGLGALCQHAQIRALCDEGVAEYDLGTTGGDYKRRWAERIEASTTMLVVRR